MTKAASGAEQAAVVKAAEGKKREQKAKYFDAVQEDGTVLLKIAFSNGDVVKVDAHAQLIEKLIAAGMKALFSGIVGGAKSLEDARKAVDAAVEKFNKGEWPTAVRGQGNGKVDDLAKAVAEVKEVSEEAAQKWLDEREKAHKGHKLSVRRIPEVAAVLARYAQERHAANGAGALVNHFEGL